MFVPSIVYNLTNLCDIRDTTPHNIHNDFYIIGDIHRRGIEDLIFKVNQSFFELTQ